VDNRLKIETYIKGYEAAAPGRTLSVFSADEQYELAKLALSALDREGLDLGRFVNDANIGGADAPHEVVEKLQLAINVSALKREQNAAARGASDE
jgi:hypothetical protein